MVATSMIIGENSMILPYSLAVGGISLLFRGIKSKVNMFSVHHYAGLPRVFGATLKENDSLDPVLVSHAAVEDVLSPGGRSEIAPAIIAGVIVNVVNLFRKWQSYHKNPRNPTSGDTLSKDAELPVPFGINPPGLSPRLGSSGPWYKPKEITRRGVIFDGLSKTRDFLVRMSHMFALSKRNLLVN